MNILIVGATRGIRRQLLEQALASGNSVTVLARDASVPGEKEQLS